HIFLDGSLFDQPDSREQGLLIVKAHRASMAPRLQRRRHGLCRIARCAVILLLPLGLCTLAGCSGAADRDNPDAWYNKTMAENFAGRPPAQPYAASAQAAVVGPATGSTVASNARLVTSEQELYRSEASCGGVSLVAPNARAQSPRGTISLD